MTQSALKGQWPDQIGGGEHGADLIAVVLLSATQRDERNMIESIDAKYGPAFVADDDGLTR